MDNLNQFVVFRVGLEEYAIPILKINEVLRLKGLEITQVPNTQKYIMGIINLRGEVVPVLDMRLRFHMPQKPLDDDNRIIIVSVKGKTIGFLVDSVSEVAQVEEKDISEPPEEISDINTKYIVGVAKYKDRIFIILDIDLIVEDKPEPEPLD